MALGYVFITLEGFSILSGKSSFFIIIYNPSSTPFFVLRGCSSCTAGEGGPVLLRGEDAAPCSAFWILVLYIASATAACTWVIRPFGCYLLHGRFGPLQPLPPIVPSLHLYCSAIFSDVYTLNGSPPVWMRGETAAESFALLWTRWELLPSALFNYCPECSCLSVDA